MTTHKKGFLTSFEGIDGSGKTTQIKLLKKYLIKKGYDVEIIEDSKISGKIMRIFLEPRNMYPKVELLLHAAIHAQDIQELILQMLNKGKILISDRFLDATIAYQGYGRGIDLNAIKWLSEFTAEKLKPRCGARNSPDAKFCSKHGLCLDAKTSAEIDELRLKAYRLMNELIRNPKVLNALVEGIGKLKDNLS